MALCWKPLPACFHLCCKSLFGVFPCVRKCNQWPGSRRTPQPGLPVLARGATKSMVICCLARRLALQKRHLPCCKCSPGRQPVRSVFRALRLAATASAKQRTRSEAFEQALTCSLRCLGMVEHHRRNTQAQAMNADSGRRACPNMSRRAGHAAQ